MKATQVSVDGWMDKQNMIYNVVYTYNGILAFKKKEILQVLMTWMQLEGIMLSEISQRKINTAWYHLCVETFYKKSNS